MPTLFDRAGKKILQAQITRARTENTELEQLGFRSVIVNGKPDRGEWISPDGVRLTRNQALTMAGIPRRPYLEGIDLPAGLDQ